jgi:hypothetical protein
MSKNQNTPYKALGARLKYLREQWKQSIKEVSGTLEIDEPTLREIEAGKIMPTDSMLDMFINHFLLTEDQADELRGLAQQNDPQTLDSVASNFEDLIMKQVVLLSPSERTIYTDSMQATVNKSGVVLQFMQASPNQTNPQQITVSRIGMSREHAEKMIQVLRTTLDQHDRSGGNKLLPPKSEDKA